MPEQALTAMPEGKGCHRKKPIFRACYLHQATYVVTRGRECRYQKHPGAWSGSELKAFNATAQCGKVAC